MESSESFTLPLSHMRSCSKLGLTETVVVVHKWSGSRVTLMLSLIGKIRVSSLFPQYLITAMLVGVWAVTITTHFCNSSAISNPITRILNSQSNVWIALRSSHKNFDLQPPNAIKLQELNGKGLICERELELDLKIWKWGLKKKMGSM